jgi:hypothetical protein
MGMFGNVAANHWPQERAKGAKKAPREFLPDIHAPTATQMVIGKCHSSFRLRITVILLRVNRYF